MNPRTLIALAAVAATAAVIYATASSASPNAWTVERYYSNETSHVFADIGAKGAGPADVYVAQQSLRSTGGEKVGVVNGYGVNLHRPYVFFHWTAALDAGTLTVEGAVDLRRDVQVYAIVGGTGRYAGARGTVTSSDAGKRGSLVVVRYER